ncbi:MAG: hypothetical protein JNM84_23375 [Planctomycetes bacterium]|nr:hypothetical protein [Planctomycetota bacterium]
MILLRAQLRTARGPRPRVYAPARSALVLAGAEAAEVRSPQRADLLALGVERSHWLGLALPFDLGLLGATGCELATSIDVPSAQVADPQGLLGVAFPLPLDEALVGVELAAQWLVLAPGVNPAGLASSQAIGLHIAR